MDVIGRIVSLKKAGSNYKGLCPFHNEKTPSFVVSETKQIFTCFGCGASGDVIKFIEKYYQMDFISACEKLASEYSIDISAYRSSVEKNKDEFYEINREAAKFFYKTFRKPENKGYAYMSNRGIALETLIKFGIGYADEKWTSLYEYMKSLGYNEEALVALGLISESKGRYFDKFRDRVIFPIMNTNGKVIGFGGRSLSDDAPKYLNSPETPIFQKKNNLYGLNLTRQEINKENQAILVEGYMDVISLYQHGVRNTVASLGTALTENQSRLIKRYTLNVAISYDADEAGINAALRGMDILYEQGLHVKVLNITDGNDPDEFIKEYGRKAFLNLVDGALPFADYKFHVLSERFDLTDTEGQVSFFREAVKVLKQLNPIEADIYIKKLSEKMKISQGAIRNEISEERDIISDRSYSDYREEKDKDEILSMSQLEKNFIKLMVTDQKYCKAFDGYNHVFLSGIGKNILEAIKEQYCRRDILDIKLLMDSLEENERTALKDIDKNIRFAAKEDDVFNDCLAAAKKAELVAREKELMLSLSLADEENNLEGINKLMKELKSIQAEISNERSNL